MCAQREVGGCDEIQQFIEDTKISHPLPEGAKYVAVPEDSPFFWKNLGVDGPLKSGSEGTLKDGQVPVSN